MTVTPKKIVGNLAEKNAYGFLKEQGMRLIMQNFTCRMGEVDLIMQDGNTIAFVEVRSRANQNYGSAIESVTPSKQRKIIKTAIYFLQQRKLLNKVDFRFDIIGICDDKLEWIKNAFTADIMT